MPFGSDGVLMCLKSLNEVKRDFGDFDNPSAICSARSHRQKLKNPRGKAGRVHEAVIKMANEVLRDIESETVIDPHAGSKRGRKSSKIHR